MVCRITQRLAMMGYEVQEADEALLVFCLDSVLSHIKNACNLQEVPKALDFVVIMRVCGSFLSGKYNVGGLEGFDFEGAVKSVSAGDTSVTFEAGTSAQSRFELCLDNMCKAGIW